MLADAADVDEIADALGAVAAEMRNYLGRSEISRMQWKRLGVRVIAVEMAASGACHRDGGERVVFVNASDDPRRQRFTSAHELCHLLLDEPRSRLRLSRSNEERLCNSFAADLVIPRAELEVELVDRRRLEPDDVVALCNRFGVTLQAIMVALRDYLDEDQVLIVARDVGHPRRPDVVDFRFHASCARSIYLPRHQRLRSTGLSALADWTRAAGEGRRRGSDFATFELRRTHPPGSGIACGRACWSARLLPNRLLLATIEAAAMRFNWRETSTKLAA